jgi:hypothetical protein
VVGSFRADPPIFFARTSYDLIGSDAVVLIVVKLGGNIRE